MVWYGIERNGIELLDRHGMEWNQNTLDNMNNIVKKL